MKSHHVGLLLALAALGACVVAPLGPDDASPARPDADAGDTRSMPPEPDGSGPGRDAAPDQVVDAGDPCELCEDDAYAHACDAERAACSADAACSAFLSCLAACRDADCQRACGDSLTPRAVVLAIDLLSVCPCRPCQSVCGDQCALAGQVAMSPSRADCSPCDQANAYDPVCAGRLCLDVGNADHGVHALECTRPCRSDAECSHGMQCDLSHGAENGSCAPTTNGARCSADRRAVESLDSCGNVYDRVACAATEECDPTTSACHAVGGGGFCTACTSDLDCASRACQRTGATGYCTRTCTSASSCGPGFSCAGGRCVGTAHAQCSADHNAIVNVDACGNVTSTRETCTGNNACQYLSDRVTPYCGFACTTANSRAHFGTGHCTYTTYNRSTGQCCGTCIDYSCPECGALTWSDCTAAF